MDDRRVGLVIRALRRRRGWRQIDLAAAASVSQSGVSRAELGHLEALSFRVVRRLLAALDARVEFDVRWRGGELDRIMDEQHARLAVAVAGELRRLGWEVVSEATFMRFGERGSYDLLAARRAELAVAMFELKSEVTSAEETQRRFDAKRRVLASVAEERFGFRPRQFGCFLVLTDTTRNRARITILAGLLDAALALGTRQVRRWLREPAGTVSGAWFVRLSHPWGHKCRPPGSHRVRKPTRPGVASSSCDIAHGLPGGRVSSTNPPPLVDGSLSVSAYHPNGR